MGSGLVLHLLNTPGNPKGHHKKQGKKETGKTDLDTQDPLRQYEIIESDHQTGEEDKVSCMPDRTGSKLKTEGKDDGHQ